MHTDRQAAQRKKLLCGTGQQHLSSCNQHCLMNAPTGGSGVQEEHNISAIRPGYPLTAACSSMNDPVGGSGMQEEHTQHISNGIRPSSPTLTAAARFRMSPAAPACCVLLETYSCSCHGSADAPRRVGIAEFCPICMCCMQCNGSCEVAAVYVQQQLLTCHAGCLPWGCLRCSPDCSQWMGSCSTA